MTLRERTTNVLLKIRSGVHSRMKLAAVAQGLQLNDAYERAADLWSATHIKATPDRTRASVSLSNELQDEVLRLGELARKTQAETSAPRR